MILENNVFISLMHPIQWTIANPVGADWPAKWQKKPLLCIRQVAHRTSFQPRQCDIIASFLFGMCTVQTDYFVRI